MTNQQKQDFTRRLSQCNSGEMIVIMYDIYFTYQQEVKEALAREDRETFKSSLRKMQNTLETLIGALDFKYPVSQQLFSLYVYCKKELAKAMYQGKLEPVEEAANVMRPLHSSFTEAAKSDTSGPVMANAQTVYAGMTYGKGELNENYMEQSGRGFFA